MGDSKSINTTLTVLRQAQDERKSGVRPLKVSLSNHILYVAFSLHLRRSVPIALMLLFAVLLAACSSDPTPPRDLLLGPGDFPGQAVTETSRETGETSLYEPAVQVELSGPDFTLLESLVLFESGHLALTILGEIKRDQTAQGVTAQPVDGFDDNSGVIGDQLHGDDAATLFFVQGRALVRITLTGDGRTERVWEIARLARDKSGGQ